MTQLKQALMQRQLDKLEKRDCKKPVEFSKFKVLPWGQGNSRIIRLAGDLPGVLVQLSSQHHHNHPKSTSTNTTSRVLLNASRD